MTASQIVSQFGEENVSEVVRQAVNTDAHEAWFKVCHLICEDRDQETHFPYVSVYWEEGKESPLSVGGYEEFPVLVPRWEVRGNDFYGYGPGWKALGESKMLQELRSDYLTAQQMMIQPPVFGPASLRERRVNLFPGAMNYLDDKDSFIKPIHQFVPDIQGQLAAIQESRNMINKLFYSDLFLSIAGANNPQWTAFEVQARQQERLQMIGPVVLNLINELYDPLIGRVFGIMNRRGMFLEPPEELIGSEIKIEYVSILALAQKASGLSELSNLMGVIGQVAQMQPEVADKLNCDAIVDQFVRTTNIPAAIIRPDSDVEAIRQQRAQQAQQAQEMAAAQQVAATARQGAGAVKELGTADGNLLNSLIGGGGIDE
jgi:hypothetical protein